VLYSAGSLYADGAGLDDVDGVDEDEGDEERGCAGRRLRKMLMPSPFRHARPVHPHLR
jgi:hypothetical protein